MQSAVEELELRRNYLSDQVAIKREFGREGAVRSELLAVTEQIRAFTVDTPSKEVTNALQQEAALSLRLSRGEAELARVESDIAYAQQNVQSAALRSEGARREMQRKRDGILAQVAAIDDQIAGRKLIKPVGHLRGSDIQDDIQRQRRELQQLRERVMQEAGLTEADIPGHCPAAVNTGIRPDGGGGGW